MDFRTNVYEHTLSLDYETYGEINLQNAGLHRYAQHKSFEILMVAYSLDGAPVEVLDLTKQRMPAWLGKMLLSDKVLKTAWNAQFERVSTEQYFNTKLSPVSWQCGMCMAAMATLPLKLDAAGKALKLDVYKNPAGYGLIKYFSVPQEPTHLNNYRLRNLPTDAPEKFGGFMRYCADDVRAEQAILQKIKQLPIFVQSEAEVYNLDQRINDRGVRIHMPMVRNAVKMDMDFRDKVVAEAREITGIDSPTKLAQLKKWLSVEMDEEILKLNKETIPGILKKTDSEIVKRVIELRQMSAKTSVSKYSKMGLSGAQDHVVRGMFQYAGAQRTLRFAGRLVQLHNLPKNELLDLDLARKLVLEGDADTLEMLFGSIPSVLSELIRTAFIPSEGRRLIVSDFTAIEACIVAWLAKEKWRLKVFEEGGDIYKESYARMFGMPLDKVSREQRQQGKVAELALGYEGGEAALTKMDKKNELKDNEKEKIKNAWRNSNPNIARLWKVLNSMAIDVVTNGGERRLTKDIIFSKSNGNFYIHLPSGRKMVYLRASIITNKFGSPSVSYEGQNQTTNKWERQDTYGGKLLENITQAIARDLLVSAMLRVEKAGYEIVMHIHDEIVVDVPVYDDALDHITELMKTKPGWAEGLPLSAKSYETSYYKKD